MRLELASSPAAATGERARTPSAAAPRERPPGDRSRNPLLRVSAGVGTISAWTPLFDGSTAS